MVEVVRTLVFGTLCLLGALLRSLDGEHDDQHVVRGAEQRDGPASELAGSVARPTAFSKDLAMHRAASYFIGYSYNFCWPVRTLRVAGARRVMAGSDSRDGRGLE